MSILASISVALQQGTQSLSDGQQTTATAQAMQTAKRQLGEEQTKFVGMVEYLIRRQTPSDAALVRSVELKLTIASPEMSKAGYDLAFAKAELTRAGVSDVTDAEAARFMGLYKRASGTEFGIMSDVKQMRASHATGNLKVVSRPFHAEVARAGRELIETERRIINHQSIEVRQAIHAELDRTAVDYLKAHYNSVVNIPNYALKSTGVQLPRAEYGSEYFQKNGAAAEMGGTTAVAILTAGVAPTASKVLTLGSTITAGYEAVTGVDALDKHELTTLERVTSGAGAVLGATSLTPTAKQVASEIKAALQESVPPPPNAPAVVTNGGAATMRLPRSFDSQPQSLAPQGASVPTGAANAIAGKDGILRPPSHQPSEIGTRIESRSSHHLSGSRGVKFEDEALARAKAEHPEGFKPDVETQRLGLTNRTAADWVGLQKTKSGNYIAHITEITVKHKSLSELGKQLDGAQKIASSKLGDQITKYEYYISTSSKELVTELAKRGNSIPKPGGSGSFNVTVIFDGGGKR